MRKLIIGLLVIATVLTVMYAGTTLQAQPLTIRPGQEPAVDFDALTLEQQLAFIDAIRPKPPIVLPVQFSTGRAVPPSPSLPLPPALVESLIHTYFRPEDWEWALRVSYCESNWIATATNKSSGAAGLFQHMPQWWEGRSVAAGWGGWSVYDETANVAVAAWLLAQNGKASWVCK